MVTCIALWTDVAPARDKSKDSSSLSVVWFQDEFAMPIDDLILGQLRAIDWELSATAEEY
jgi:hypothetical protein